MTSLKTSIKTITYLSDIGCLEIQGASLLRSGKPVDDIIIMHGTQNHTEYGICHLSNNNV